MHEQIDEWSLVCPYAKICVMSRVERTYVGVNFAHAQKFGS